MGYGRSVLNFERSMHGIKGTGCACGIAGSSGTLGVSGVAEKPVRAIVWLIDGAGMPNIGVAAAAVGARIIRGLPDFPGLQNTLGVAESAGPSVLGMSTRAKVYPLTTPMGDPVDAGDALYDAEVLIRRALGEIDQLDETVLGILAIKGEGEEAAYARAQWYRTQVGVFEAAIARMRTSIFIPLAIQMEIIKNSRADKRYAPALKDLEDLSATLSRRLASLGTQIASWKVEAEWQSRNAANRSAWSGYVELANSAMNFFRTGWRAANTAAEAFEEGAKGAKRLIDDADDATKAGLAGIAMLVGVGFVALLMFGGRKK